MASLSDGQSLINYLNENDIPDIILLDLVMPEMNGIEVTEYVKSHFDIKVLVLTSYVDDEHVISAINKGLMDMK